jgi:pimeloyl-ACP methyl ester carboxylesterase
MMSGDASQISPSSFYLDWRHRHLARSHLRRRPILSADFERGDGARDQRVLVGDTLSDDTLHRMVRRTLDHAPQSFALAGVSMGGMVALEMMRMGPERVT